MTLNRAQHCEWNVTCKDCGKDLHVEYPRDAGKILCDRCQACILAPDGVMASASNRGQR